jgi:TFIIF-interacting CTD phosphatase-like protein
MVAGITEFNLTTLYHTYYFQDSVETYNGPNPMELLAPLFTQLSCSYKVSQYFTEGKYVPTGSLM